MIFIKSAVVVFGLLAAAVYADVDEHDDHRCSSISGVHYAAGGTGNVYASHHPHITPHPVPASLSQAEREKLDTIPDANEKTTLATSTRCTTTFYGQLLPDMPGPVFTEWTSTTTVTGGLADCDMPATCKFEFNDASSKGYASTGINGKKFTKTTTISSILELVSPTCWFPDDPRSTKSSKTPVSISIASRTPGPTFSPGSKTVESHASEATPDGDGSTSSSKKTSSTTFTTLVTSSASASPISTAPCTTTFYGQLLPPMDGPTFTIWTSTTTETGGFMSCGSCAFTYHDALSAGYGSTGMNGETFTETKTTSSILTLVSPTCYFHPLSSSAIVAQPTRVGVGSSGITATASA